MKATMILGVALLFAQCSNDESNIDFFANMQKTPSFANVNEKNIRDFGLDSVRISARSFKANNLISWYMTSPPNALFNIEGYIRSEDGVILIHSSEKHFDVDARWDILFNFRDSVLSSQISYIRKEVFYKMVIVKDGGYYNKNVGDSVSLFRVTKESQLSEMPIGFYIQASLKTGIISYLYLSKGELKIYTIDYLPNPKISIETATSHKYPVL